jgi:hypothetical protein
MGFSSFNSFNGSHILNHVLAPPTNLAVSETGTGAGKASLTFTASTGATSYTLFSSLGGASYVTAPSYSVSGTTVSITGLTQGGVYTFQMKSNNNSGVSSVSSSPSNSITMVIPISIYQFLSSGSITLMTQKTVNYLIVAGGGGGGDNGDYSSGGGGAGGYKLGSITLSAGTYSVTVGDGGLGGQDANTIVNKIGGNSSFASITADGGGGGAGGDNNPDVSPSNVGGSGGGGSTWLGPSNGIAGEGFGGASGSRAPTGYYGYRGGVGGGGGGASTAGSIGFAANNSTSYGGNGGNGITINSSNFTGYNKTSYFCGGGGGANYNGNGGIGTSGGGVGRSLGGINSSQAQLAGTANTGGGGGGCNQDGTTGGPGGSGIVILIY